MRFYPGLFQYFSSWKYPGSALRGLHGFSLHPMMLELLWVELCQVCHLPGRKIQCCQKCSLVLRGCLGISWQLELLGLCGLWQSSGLQMFMSRRSCGCSHIQNHERLSWCLCRPGPGEVLFFGLALNLMNVSFYSLAQDELLFFSTAAVPEYTAQGKGKPLGFSCFHFTQRLLCPYHCRCGQPFACQGKLCLVWQVPGLLLDLEGVQECGTLLIPPPAFAEGLILCSALIPTWIFFFCEALWDHCFLCAVKMFGLKCFIFVALKTLLGHWDLSWAALCILALAWPFSAVCAIRAVQLCCQMQWVSVGQQSQTKGQSIQASDNAKLIAILHKITTWNGISSMLLQILGKSSQLAFAQ